MTQKFLAKAVKGYEFVFSKKIMIAVPNRSAKAIADTLNRMKYQLNDGEIWFVYDNDYYYNDFINREIKSFSPTKNRIIIHNR